MSSSDKAKWTVANDDPEQDLMMVEDSEEEMEDVREAIAESIREQQQFGRISRGPHASEYLRQYADSFDEKGEPLNTMVPPEKFVHHSFFNSFDDDFDDEDLA
ncbi:hypothetical protein VTP01DRAFT_8345 [Rhizomucor pusillus]|uniref:uncharacterized protein n=1 Tax=Rhizomucor pusillus TaxID=4840 RepID=UPI0037442F46